MAKRNLQELEIESSRVFALKYKNLLGNNPNQKANVVFGTLQIEHEQPAIGVIGDVQIEGEKVLNDLQALADSPAFQSFAVSLAVARAADIDVSPSVARMVFKIEQAIEKLKKPDMGEIIKTNCRAAREIEKNPQFVIRTFD